MKIPLLLVMALLIGCSTPSLKNNSASDDIPMYKKAYEIYPGVGGNGISKHLIRSHTTAILVRPGSSALELCNRGIDQVWDWTRRLETRFIKFPMLHEQESPNR